jgi:hypothetical protein
VPAGQAGRLLGAADDTYHGEAFRSGSAASRRVAR